MSTRGTLFYATYKNSVYHAWTDCIEEGIVFIGTGERSDRENEVRIPIEVWDIMRRQNPMQWQRDVAAKTDADILAEVTADVNRRAAAYKAGNKCAGLDGFLTYGPVTLSKGAQIAAGLLAWKETRKQARRLVRAAKRIQEKANG